MSWENDLAKEFKNRNNKKLIGPIVGKLVSVDPVLISIFDGDIMLGSNNLYLSDGSSGLSYETGAELLLIPSNSEQIFFIINKAIKL